MARKLFMCNISDGRNESCIEHAVMVLALPSHIGGATLHVHFAPNLQRGLDAFKQLDPSEDDIFVAIDSMVSGLTFVTSALTSPHQFVFGTHAQPEIDWERVAKGLTPYITNFEDLISSDPAQRGYVQLESKPNEAAFTSAKALWIKGSVLKDLGHLRIFEWDGPIYVDTKNQLSIMAKLSFTGCVGYRAAAECFR